ncbi:MAG TPA: N-acetyltransferase [Polyangiaceae bacterium]
MKKAVIRDARPSDLPHAAALGAQIVRLHHAANPKRFFMLDDPEQGYAWWLGRELERPEAVVLVAELNQCGSNEEASESNCEIVGFAYGALEERDWSILVDRHGAFHDLCVAESVRRQGIGRDLAMAMLARLTALGAPRILLRAMVSNQSAQNLAKALGFLPTMLEMTREGDQ